MGRTATKRNLTKSLLEANGEEFESKLYLPTVHSLSQEQLVYAWELRYDPVTDPQKKYACYRPNVAEWHTWPLAYPNLRVVVGACGTKFGKTHGCCIRMVKEAWDNKGSRNWWVAPSQEQSENAMEEIAKMLPPGRFEVLIGKHRILVKTSSGDVWSTIEFKTGSDPSKLRGYGVHFYVMDEAAQGMPYGSFVSVETTTTNTRGRGIVISTPNGRGWFYDVYEWGEKFYADGAPRFSEDEPDPHPDFMSIRMPSHANPFNDLKVIEEKRNTLSRDVFRQEYLAQFMLESAGVFTNFGSFFDKEMKFLDGPIEGHIYVAGIDLADLDDYTVITVMDRIERRIVAWHRFHKIGWAAQKIKIAGIVEHWGATAVIDDSGIGDPINEDLRAMGVRLFPYKISTNAAKCHLIETLQLALENSSLKSPYIGILKGELEFYERKETPSKNYTYSAPRGKHDDAVVSLALATLLCMQKPAIYKYRQVRGI
jgi:hypothetical protein